MNRILLSIGPINIYYYSITMLIAVLVGLYLATKESKKVGISEYFEDLTVSAILLGIIGARLYYVIFNFTLFSAVSKQGVC